MHDNIALDTGKLERPFPQEISLGLSSPDYPGAFGGRCCGCGGFFTPADPICICGWDHEEQVRYLFQGKSHKPPKSPDYPGTFGNRCGGCGHSLDETRICGICGWDHDQHTRC